MILSYRIFLRTGRDKLLSQLQVQAKKHYPTSLKGIAQSGLEDSRVQYLIAWHRAHPHVSERLLVAVFIKHLMRECGRSNYAGRAALLVWLSKQKLKDEDNREIADLARDYARFSELEMQRLAQ